MRRASATRVERLRDLAVPIVLMLSAYVAGIAAGAGVTEGIVRYAIVGLLGASTSYYLRTSWEVIAWYREGLRDGWREPLR